MWILLNCKNILPFILQRMTQYDKFSHKIYAIPIIMKMEMKICVMRKGWTKKNDNTQQQQHTKIVAFSIYYYHYYYIFYYVLCMNEKHIFILDER